MKFTINQPELKTILNIVSRAVPSRPTHPILANILLVAEGKFITITGFDLSISIKANLLADIEREGKITLPARLFTDIISKLPEGEVIIGYEENQEDSDFPLVEIQSLSGTFKLRGTIADEYPEINSVDAKFKKVFDVSTIANGLKLSSFASSDETQQILTGFHLAITQEKVEFATTNGHRLGVVTLPDTENETAVSLTFPTRAIKEIENAIKNTTQTELILIADEDKVAFELDNITITSRVLSGTYPSYHNLIPTSFTTGMIGNRKRIIDTLERLSVLTDQKNPLIRFSLSDENQSVIISVSAKELGNAKEELKSEINGESFDIGFNIKYLLEGLKVIDSSEVQFNFNNPNQPVIINPLTGDKMTYLIMPVQLKD